MRASGAQTSTGAPEPVLNGTLEHEGMQLSVALAHATRLSLFIQISGQTGGVSHIPDRTVFPRLTVTLGERTVEMGRCQLYVEYTRKGGDGRLVFLDDIYDCRALVFDQKLVNLKTYFRNLPVVLGQKERIKPEFREYVSALTYDLSVFKKFFNEQDRVLANEPPAVARAGQDALLRTEGREFLKFFDTTLEQLGKIVQGFDKEEHERHGFYLRRQVWDFILASEFLKRTNLKPRGYAGDAEMMQMTYENQYVGNYVFNKLLHKHPLETPSAHAVRNRRRFIPRCVRASLARFPDPTQKLKVLSVACGPAWELQDMFHDSSDFQRLQCTLLDQDPHALDIAREGIRRIEAARDIELGVRFISESVRTMLRERNMKDRFGSQHFIYSMGLFDYLTPPVARALARKIFDLLEPGGTMVIGNFHLDNPTRYYMEYWMDWVLYYRTADDMKDLVADLPGAQASLSYDESGCQMFLHVEKQA
ncbi:MAG: class I SAM-dependent methyltransferase [Myxococcaceae bacterium]